MVHVIKSVEFDQEKHEKYVMMAIYDSEIDELREGMKHFEDHWRKVHNPKDTSDIEKMKRISSLKQSVDEVWDKLNS